MSNDDVRVPQYSGLPAAASFEQAIILAQLLIMRDLERRARLLQAQTENPPPALPEAA